VTAIAGWLLYAESLDAFLAAGAALILLGNAVNLRGPATTGLRGMPTRTPEPGPPKPSP
jgi:drug/metabolite transporter (DMT)-like permease